MHSDALSCVSCSVSSCSVLPCLVLFFSVLFCRISHDKVSYRLKTSTLHSGENCRAWSFRSFYSHTLYPFIHLRYTKTRQRPRPNPRQQYPKPEAESQSPPPPLPLPAKTSSTRKKTIQYICKRCWENVIDNAVAPPPSPSPLPSILYCLVFVLAMPCLCLVLCCLCPLFIFAFSTLELCARKLSFRNSSNSWGVFPTKKSVSLQYMRSRRWD